MYKLGRGGGGRGGPKRPLPPPPLTRPATAPGAARMPLGGAARSRPGSASGGGGAALGKDESFSLSSAADLDFGAIIRLTPDLIEEIRRVESQGGSARIKFAPNTNFAGGNVIDVGGKEFGFTWSRDDLCDIYEERQSGEDGDGLLVERGSAWRKLNVHRILDESTKKHVKKRSEEAERLSKSRKAIVLDPANPAMKNQVKKMAAAGVEGNMRRTGWKQKKEPFYRKQNAEPTQGPQKPIYKSGTSSNKPTKGMSSVAPISSPREHPQARASVSPLATGVSSRGDANFEEIFAPLDVNKEHIDIGNLEKEMPTRILHGAKHRVTSEKGNISDQPMYLQSIRADKTSQNPKGMNFKNEASRTPLKYGEEVDGSKQREPDENESAPDITSTRDSIFGERVTGGDFGRQVQPSSKIEENLFGNIDIMDDDPDPFNSNGKKISNHREGRASSSESGSDSDSESESSDSGSDSGGQSRSRSKSRSPVGSASASSSDSDGSSSSKDGSDVEVNITSSEDEKEVAMSKTEAVHLNLSSSPRMRASDDEQEQIDIIGDQEENVAPSPIDLNCFGLNDEVTNSIEDVKVFPSKNTVKASENTEMRLSKSMGSDLYGADPGSPAEDIPFSPDQYKRSKDPLQSVVKLPSEANEQATKMTDWFPHEQTKDVHKVKNKRASSSEFLKEKAEIADRSKSTRADEVMPSGKSKYGATRYMSPEKPRQDLYKSNSTDWGGARDDGTEYNQYERSRSVPFNSHKVQQSADFWNSSNVDSEQPGTQIGDISERRKSTDRFNKKLERISAHPDTITKNKIYRDKQGENIFGDQVSTFSDSQIKISGDHGGYWKENRPPSKIRKSDENKSPASSEKGSALRRELSDLEVGELREAPVGGEVVGVKRSFEGKKYLKSSESNPNFVDSSNLDINDGRSVSRQLLELKKQSTHPCNIRGEGTGNQDASCRKMPDEPVDAARVLQRTVPSQGQQNSKVNADSEGKYHLDNPTEITRRGESGTNTVVGLENDAAPFKKTPSSMASQKENKHVGPKGYKKSNELKQKPNTLGDSADQSNNSASVGNDVNSRKRRESSSEEDDSFYSKYDKEVPHLKDTIKEFSQYQDYVQEYREKYDCYVSLNKNLENIRNDFLKVSEELDLAKERDSEEYYKVVEQLRELYRQHGERNKKMKKVFMVLHDELKNLKQRIRDFVDIQAKE